MNVLLGYESMYGTCEKVAPAVADGHVVGGSTQAFSTTPDPTREEGVQPT
jgi:hypothetical protein